MKWELEKNKNAGIFEVTSDVRSGSKLMLARSHFSYSNVRSARKGKGEGWNY
jgi:hypothetical protein